MNESEDPTMAEEEAAAWHRANPNAGLSSRVEWQRLVDQGIDMDEEYRKIYGEYPSPRQD